MTGLSARTLALCLVVACSAGRAPPPEPSSAPGSPASEPEPVARSSDAAAGAPPPVTSGAPSPAPAPAEPAFAPAHAFPPPDVKPPFERSAAAEDGRWKPFGEARGRDGKPLFYTTVIHPHEASRFITLTVVAIDLTRTRLGFLPGVDDVGKTPVPFAPGLVPENERAALVAVFNGGFMPKHGRWGMRVGETTILPPREPGCTVALFDDGVRIRSWPALAARDAEIRALRQTPPCLLEQGAVHPNLLAGRDKAWAGQTPGIVTRRRSAIGITEDGRTLFYAIGVETPAKLLATGLAAVGAHDAAQLDINWNWTRFLLFGPTEDGKLGVTATLAEVEHGKRDYVGRASERDFFYVLRRD